MTMKQKRWTGSNLQGFQYRNGKVVAKAWHTAKGAGYRVDVEHGFFTELGYARYATNMGDAMRRATAWADREAGR